LDITPASYFVSTKTVNLTTRIVNTNYRTELVINEGNITSYLSNQLKIQGNDAEKTIPLVNNDWFTGNFLGYNISCNNATPNCTDYISVKNLVDPLTVDFASYYNETTTN